MCELPKGGARNRSGPPPDPNALHRDKDAKDWVTLPEAREGAVPEWPLATKPSAAERDLWEKVWKKPQAVMWELQGQEDEVALYVRKFVEASRPKSPSTIVTAQRQMADSLGLTNPGLRFNKWRMGGAATPEAVKDQPATVSSRERFRVVDGTG